MTTVDVGLEQDRLEGGVLGPLAVPGQRHQVVRRRLSGANVEVQIAPGMKSAFFKFNKKYHNILKPNPDSKNRTVACTITVLRS